MFLKIKKYYEKIMEEVSALQARVDSSPDGAFFAFKDDNRMRIGRLINGKRQYFKQNDTALIKTFAQKKYDLLKLKQLQNEAAAIKLYLDNHSEENPAAAFAVSFPECSALLFEDDSLGDYYNWANEPYSSSAGHPEDLKCRAFDGKLVRSKSEAMIYEQLKKNKLAFRYECDLTIFGKTLCPDFQVKHPKTGKIIIWEHFGKMDDPEYRKAAMRKLQFYSEAGYILGVDLIITVETADRPFSSLDASNLIQEVFR